MGSTDRPCQQCGESFDWSESSCPDCGWQKDAWVEAGRYRLERVA